MLPNRYEQVAAISVNGHVEKKGTLSYLSWAWAVDQLLRLDPSANWQYLESTTFADGTMLVRCQVTAFGVPRTMQLPVMDYRNKAIPKPDAFAVNTAMQRCLVKAIALHGLGLYIYAGEDLPPAEDDDGNKASEAPAKDYSKHTARQTAVDEFDRMDPAEQKFIQGISTQAVALNEAQGIAAAFAYCESQRLDHEQKLALWALLPSPVRTALKAEGELGRLKPLPKHKPTPAELGSQA